MTNAYEETQHEPTPTAAPLAYAEAASAGSEAADASPRASGRGAIFWEKVNRLARYAVAGGYLAMVIAFSIASPSTFPTWDNIQNVLTLSVVPVLLVGGVTLVLIVGEFDLSFTAAAGLSAGVTVMLMSSEGLNALVASLAGIVVAGCVGLTVGAVVTAGKANSFIVSLAVGSVATGIETTLTNDRTIYQGIPNSYLAFATKNLGGITVPVMVAAVVALLLYVMTRHTKEGRHVYAVGSNATASHLAGISVRRLKILAFTITGLLAGLAGIVITSRSGSYFPDAATSYLLSTYAAAFLGSAAQRGRSFSIAGSVLGVLWLVTLQAGLTDLNVSSSLIDIVEGVVLVAAVVLAVRNNTVTISSKPRKR